MNFAKVEGGVQFIGRGGICTDKYGKNIDQLSLGIINHYLQFVSHFVCFTYLFLCIYFY